MDAIAMAARSGTPVTNTHLQERRAAVGCVLLLACANVRTPAPVDP
jgi:hypothetical protein